MEDEIRDIMREELDKTGLSPVVFPDVQKVEVINQQAPIVNVPAPIVNVTTPEPVNIEPILERIESAINSAPEFDYNRFEKIAKENKSIYQGGAMGPSKLFVRNATGAVVSPATEAKQDDIITAIGAIPGGGGIQYTEGDTDASITGTAVMWEDAANTLVPVSSAKPLPVSATIDTTGLALAANQLPDGHNVTVDNASIAVTGTFWQATQPVSGTVTATGPLTDTELRATPVPVSGTFYQATQPISGTVSVNALPTGTNNIGDVDVLTLPSIPAGTNNIGDVDVLTLPLEARTATAVDASASGDTTIVAITNTPRLYYISLSANGANSADVTATVKIGASTKYKVSLKAGSIWARNVGAGRAYISGSAGDDIVVNLSAAQTVHVSVEYADA